MKRCASILGLLLLLPSSADCQNPQSDKNAPLEIIIKSDKQVYEEGEPILINLTIRNISKGKVNVFTRYLKGLYRGDDCYIANSANERIPCDGREQEDARKASEFMILEPGKAGQFNFDISRSLTQKLKADTYAVTYVYRGWDVGAWESRIFMEGEWPWVGTVRSNTIRFAAPRGWSPPHTLRHQSESQVRIIFNQARECASGLLARIRNGMFFCREFDKVALGTILDFVRYAKNPPIFFYPALLLTVIAGGCLFVIKISSRALIFNEFSLVLLWFFLLFVLAEVPIALGRPGWNNAFGHFITIYLAALIPILLLLTIALILIILRYSKHSKSGVLSFSAAILSLGFFICGSVSPIAVGRFLFLSVQPDRFRLFAGDTFSDKMADNPIWHSLAHFFLWGAVIIPCWWGIYLGFRALRRDKGETLAIRGLRISLSLFLLSYICETIVPLLYMIRLKFF